MSTKTKLIIISILSVLALFNAGYLSYDWIFSVQSATSLYFPVWDITWGGSFCDINSTLSCSAVLQNPLSQIYWIPFPVFALFVYPVILIIALLWLAWKIKKHFKILSALSLFWIMFNWYFIFQETFNIGAFCPLCLMCSAIIISIFILSFTEMRKECIANKKIKNV